MTRGVRLALAVVVGLALLVSACATPTPPAPPEEEVIKAAFVYVGPIGDHGWTFEVCDDIYLHARNPFRMLRRASWQPALLWHKNSFNCLPRSDGIKSSGSFFQFEPVSDHFREFVIVQLNQAQRFQKVTRIANPNTLHR